MIDFSTTTAFGLVRRMAVLGQNGPAIYLLICEGSDFEPVQADLAAEIDVQLGARIESLAASLPVLDQWLDAPVQGPQRAVILLTLRRAEHKVISFLDRNVVLLAQRGQVLILTEFDVGERVLAAAPNLRNRMADVLAIRPDDALRRTH